MKTALTTVKMAFVAILLPCIFITQSFGQKPQQHSDWATYNGNYAGDRFSPLKQITSTNVKKLRLLHSFNLGTDVSSMQTGPVVINGVMYFSTDTITYAIDAVTGTLKWKKIRSVEKPVGYGANRGLAYLNGKLFRGASDAHVFALNAADGKILWDVPLDIAGPGVSIPMAPIAFQDMLFIGNAGGDNANITGNVYALDVNDGHVIWKFKVVPDSGDVRKTWPAAEHGHPVSGGAFWTTFTLDTLKGVLYVPAGNPAPDFDTEVRENGQELYTNSVIALAIKTGKMLGYIQLVKNDNHDWDVDSGPTLITTKDGKEIIASANKSGLLSVIDRTAINTQTEATMSSPVLSLLYEVPTTVRENELAPLSRTAFTHFKPGTLGGSEWNGAAYNPDLDLIYTGAVDWGVSVKLFPLDSAKMKYPDGANMFGGNMKFDPSATARGWVTAFDTKDGTVKWKFKAPAPILAGVTPTAGGLVFTAAQNGDVYAFDAQTGKVLWKTTTNLPNGGGVITYAVKGKQYLAVAAGMKSQLWPKPSNASKIMIYGL